MASGGVYRKTYTAWKQIQQSRTGQRNHRGMEGGLKKGKEGKQKRDGLTGRRQGYRRCQELARGGLCDTQKPRHPANGYKHSVWPCLGQSSVEGELLTCKEAA